MDKIIIASPGNEILVVKKINMSQKCGGKTKQKILRKHKNMDLNLGG